MEPIDPFGGPGFRPGNREEKRVKRKRDHPLTFSSIFGAANESPGISEGTELPRIDEGGVGLEGLLDQVHEIGEKVKENPTIANIQEYKKAVRGFLAYVVKHALALEQRESGANILKRKRFTLISIIDQRLERFAAEILAGQREQLEVLRRIDEINGLLIDLLS